MGHNCQAGCTPEIFIRPHPLYMIKKNFRTRESNISKFARSTSRGRLLPKRNFAQIQILNSCNAPSSTMQFPPRPGLPSEPLPFPGKAASAFPFFAEATLCRNRAEPNRREKQIATTRRYARRTRSRSKFVRPSVRAGCTNFDAASRRVGVPRLG
jgi:hypothetical protein